MALSSHFPDEGASVQGPQPFLPVRLGFPGFWSRRGIHPRVDSRVRQSFAAHFSKQVLLAIPIDVSRADCRVKVFGQTCHFGGIGIWSPT
jgi:hypothetical protein